MPWLLGAWLCFPGALAAAESSASELAAATLLAAAAEAPPLGLLPVALRLNGVPRDETVVLRISDRDWCLDPPQLLASGIRPSVTRLHVHGGNPYHCLGAAPGFRAEFMPAELRLDLELAPEAFEGLSVQGYRAPEVTAPQVGYGTFLNYDLLGTHSEFAGGAEVPWQLGSLGEAVVYTPAGFLQGSAVGRDLTHEQDLPDGERRLGRLETFWRTDLPERMASLTVGDALGSAGYWGRPTRFAGVRYGTDFETRPGFVTRPQLSVAGAAAVPSVVDVYVNNSRVQSVQVPGGPFQIDELPTFANVGEARIVTTDLLGRQTVTTLPFLTSPRQLRAGLSSFSLEAGVAREELGLEGDRYGEAQAAAQLRYGFSDRLTAEGRLEGSRGQVAGGLGASFPLPAAGIVSPVLALSESDAGTGSLLSLAIERPAVTGPYAAGMVQWSAREFRQLGQDDNVAPLRLQFAANVGQRLAGGWTVGLAYAQQSPYGRVRQSVVSASLGTSWNGWALGSTLSARQAEEDSLALFATVNRSFAAGLRGSSSLRVQESERGPSAELRAQLSKTLPEGPGYGWRALAGGEYRDLEARPPAAAVSGTDGRYELAGAVRNEWATFSAEHGRAGDLTVSRLGLAGAVGLAGGAPFASRSIQRSFAVIREPALAGLAVTVNGQPTAVLDEDGYAVLPRLQPFAPNQVKVELDQAPLDVQVEPATVQVVTGSRTGHRIGFNARRLRAATVRLLQPDGEPVPLGADIELQDVAERFFVGPGGLGYLAAPASSVRVRVSWAGGQCQLDLELPETPGRPADLGERSCVPAP